MAGLGFQVDLRDTATPAVASLRAGLTPDRIQPIIGRAARNTYRTHFFGLNAQRPNALGGRRTNYYAGAARATQFRIQGDSVIVSVNQVGIRLRLDGGTVRPRVKKFLTIPAIPEAHGKRASEFSDLRFSIEYNPKVSRRMPALVQGARSLIRRRRVNGQLRVFFASVQNTRVIFWLVRSTTHRPDPTILPHPERVAAEAVRACDTYARLLWERRQPKGGS